MTIPMFVDEDAHYEYEREKYESESGLWRDFWDEVCEEIDREYDDGFTDGD